MRIEVLDDAKDDLVDGFHFYEGQSIVPCLICENQRNLRINLFVLI